MGKRYSSSFRERMVRRLSGPKRVTANSLSREVGIAQATLSRWLRDSGNVVDMTRPSRKQEKSAVRKEWTGKEKLRVLVEASSLTDAELGEYLRREGLYESDVHRWRTEAEGALGGRGGGGGEERKRIKALERELRRKESALAEAAALLVLKKKAQEIWGEEGNTTARRSGE